MSVCWTRLASGLRGVCAPGMWLMIYMVAVACARNSILISFFIPKSPRRTAPQRPGHRTAYISLRPLRALTRDRSHTERSGRSHVGPVDGRRTGRTAARRPGTGRDRLVRRPPSRRLRAPRAQSAAPETQSLASPSAPGPGARLSRAMDMRVRCVPVSCLLSPVGFSMVSCMSSAVLSILRRWRCGRRGARVARGSRRRLCARRLCARRLGLTSS